jgi:predicted phosphohydrolase
MPGGDLESCFHGDHDWWRQHLVAVRRLRPDFLTGGADQDRTWFHVEVCGVCGWMRGEATYENNSDGGQTATTVMMVDRLSESELEKLIPRVAT